MPENVYPFWPWIHLEVAQLCQMGQYLSLESSMTPTGLEASLRLINTEVWRQGGLCYSALE